MDNQEYAAENANQFVGSKARVAAIIAKVGFNAMSNTTLNSGRSGLINSFKGAYFSYASTVAQGLYPEYNSYIENVGGSKKDAAGDVLDKGYQYIQIIYDLVGGIGGDSVAAKSNASQIKVDRQRKQQREANRVPSTRNTFSQVSTRR